MKEAIENTIQSVAPVPADKEGMLKLLINKIVTDVEAYINCPVPDALQSTIELKLIGYINDSGIFMTEEERQAKAPVSSISEGDTSVSYAVSSKSVDMIGSVDFMDKAFKHTLNHYRVLS